jgi:flavin reductase (DIM6/NTAB) family NADH-FMN oxidoreductase RutF
VLDQSLQSYIYRWPYFDFERNPYWRITADGRFYMREMPEQESDLALDSRWPGFFPSPICLVTTRAGDQIALEKVVGASIVNRFPYVLALSFCTQPLSDRHHARNHFTEMLERGASVAVQFLSPGPRLDAAMQAISNVPEDQTATRIQKSGLATRSAVTNDAPVFEDAYLVYEARLVRPGRDFDGHPIYQQAWQDVGSHRIFFLEVNAIQLREDIAGGKSQILWRSLPAWPIQPDSSSSASAETGSLSAVKYQKGYNPHYAFPSEATTAFEYGEVQNGMAILRLAPLPEDQVEVDNDRARWPCFFPSSAGMITTMDDNGRPNLAPCGSTTIVSRHPLIIAPCLSYARINIRYAPRASLDMIRRQGRFGCSVPYINEKVISAIKYAGNISMRDDPDKIANSGLDVAIQNGIPRLTGMPVHYDCKVKGEIRLGTHIMFLGEVTRIFVRDDLRSDIPMEWCPWATVKPVSPCL